MSIISSHSPMSISKTVIDRYR